MTMFTRARNVGLLLVLATALLGCNTAPKTAEARKTLHDEVVASVADFKDKDPGLQRFFDGAYGYAVFPSIGEGAIGVGGAYGHGEVYQGGRRSGR